MMLDIFKPRLLEKMASHMWKPSLFLWLFTGTIGVYLALFASPPDYQQKEMVRFLYLHVPASWFALFTYSLMAVLSVLSITTKAPQFPLLTKALAIPGTLFAAISLFTGSLWGKPVWGTYWVWDARLTSMLILFFIYAGYVALTHAPSSNLKSARLGSFLVIIGFINIPIIKWSVDFWFTLHQPPSIMRFAKPALAQEFWPPLLMMVAAYACFLMASASLFYLRELALLKKLRKDDLTLQSHGKLSLEKKPDFSKAA